MATVDLNTGQLVVHRIASEQEAQEQEILLLPNTLQLRSTMGDKKSDVFKKKS